MSQLQYVAHPAGSADERFVAPELVLHDTSGMHLRGSRCRACGALAFPRAQVCAECLSLDVEDHQLPNEGTLYSFARVHQAPAGWDVPYFLGYIDLPDGLRVLAHLDDSAHSLSIGAQMRLTSGRVGQDANGQAMFSYVFAPIDGGQK